MSQNNTYRNVLLLCLLVVTFLAFYPSIHCGLLNWDDNWMVRDNALIKSLSPSNLYNIFFGEIFMLNYMPLVFLTFAIEYFFFGINPLVFHLTNVLLHLVNVWLVFTFISQIAEGTRAGIKNPSSQNQDKVVYLIAFIAAALFAIHPLRVESVTWISTRKDVLYTCFYLLSLNQYMKYIKGNNENTRLVQPYFLSMLFFLLSCASKGMAVTLSLMLPLIDYLMMRGISKKVILEKVPFLVVSIAFGLIAVFATHTELQIEAYGYYSFFDRIQFASYGFLFYLWKFILPIDLSAFYPYPSYVPGSLPNYYWLFTLICIVIASGTIYSIKKTRKLVFGMGFFFFGLVFVLQLVPVSNSIVADRYSYLSSIGLCYLAAEGFAKLIPGIGDKLNGINRRIKGVHIALLLFVMAILFVLTQQRIKVWVNSVTLWSDVIEKYPGYTTAYLSRGNAKYYFKQYEEAIHDFDVAIQQSPNDFRIFNSRGAAKKKLGDYEGAIDDYKKAIAVNPEYDVAYSNIGVVKFDQKKFVESMLFFNKAIELNARNAEHHIFRGKVSFVLGDYGDAIRDYDQSIELNPYIAEAYYFRGNTRFFMIDYTGACADWHKAVDLGSKKAAESIEKHCNNIASNKTAGTIANTYYSGGRKKLEVVNAVERGDTIQLLRLYAEQGYVKEEGVIKDGKYNGAVKWFYHGGNVKISGFYKDSIPYGDWKEYYREGTLKAEYSFENGLKNGHYQYFYSNGKLWTERIYRNGKLWEVVANFDSTGRALDMGDLTGGNGTMKIYDDGGSLIEVMVYREGLQVEKRAGSHKK